MDYSDLKMIQKRKKILRQREQLKGYEGEFETFLIEPCLEVCLPIKAVQVEGERRFMKCQIQKQIFCSK